MMLKMSSSTSKKNNQTKGNPDGVGSTLCEAGTHRPFQRVGSQCSDCVYTAMQTEPSGSGIYAAM